METCMGELWHLGVKLPRRVDPPQGAPGAGGGDVAL